MTLQAQPEEWADKRNEGITLYEVLPIGGGRWAVIGRFGWGAHLVSARNSDGTLAWSDEDPFFTHGDLGDVVLLPDSGVLHVGFLDQCDAIGPLGVVRKYDPGGGLLWEHIIWPDWILNGPHVAAKGASTLLAAAGDSLYVYDMDGNQVNGGFMPVGNVDHMHWLGDSALVVLTGTEMFLIDLQGNILNSVDLSLTPIDVRMEDGLVLVLGGHSVFYFNTDLSPVGAVSVPLPATARSFVRSEDALFLNCDNGLYALQGMAPMSLVLEWPPLPWYSTMGAAVRNGQVFTVGGQGISGRGTGIMRRLTMAGEPAVYADDIEVILDVDSAWTVFTNGYWSRWVDAKARVVNHGLDPLSSFVLHINVWVPQALCGPPEIRVDTAGVSVAPGDTILIDLGHRKVATYLYGPNAAGDGEVCIVALAPNEHADRAPFDNTNCTEVNFPVGLPEVDGRGTVVLTPNPATGFVLLSFPDGDGQAVLIRIIDQAGRQVLSQRSTTSIKTPTRIDASGLAPSIYTVTVEGTTMRWASSLVVTSE